MTTSGFMGMVNAVRRPTRRVRTAAALVAAAAVLAQTGCSTGDGEASAGPKKGGTFTFAVPVDLPSFDPYASNAGSGEMAYLAYFAYDPLVNQTADGKFASGLAESWQVGTTKTTFVLKKGITCSDGTALTATQVADALNFVGDPKNLTPYYATVPYTVTGDDASGTVTVATKQPFGFSLETVGNIPIVCAAGLKNRKAMATTSAGTGPYVLKSANQTSYTFESRSGYGWGPAGATSDAPGTPQQLVLTEVTNFTTAASQILAGQLNGGRINGPDVDRLTAAKVTHTEHPYQKVGLSFNERADHVGSDAAVRRAIYQAIDAKAVAQVIKGTPATGLRAGKPLPCAGASVQEMLPSFDPAGAGAALEAAGWKAGSDGVRVKDGRRLTFTIFFQSDDNVLELFQKYLKAVGVDAKLHRTTAQEAQDLFTKGTGDWDATYGGYAVPLPTNLQQYISGALPPAGYNFAAVKNKEYDTLSAQATAKLGDDACAGWVQAENAILKSADFTPIADASIKVFTSKGASLEANSLRVPVPTSLRLN
jgi:peptide/nickel transport system substrate-binding protein